MIPEVIPTYYPVRVSLPRRKPQTLGGLALPARHSAYYTRLYNILYIILYYTILYYTMLCYTLLYSTLLYSTLLYSTVQALRRTSRFPLRRGSGVQCGGVETLAAHKTFLQGSQIRLCDSMPVCIDSVYR